jgi:hypothetical protein
VAPARLVHGVAQAPADQREVVLRHAEHEQRGVPDVVDRVPERHLRRQRRPGGGGRHLVAGDGEHALEAGRRVEAHRVAVARTDDEPAVQRGRDVVGMPFELPRELEEGSV